MHDRNGIWMRSSKDRPPPIQNQGFLDEVLKSGTGFPIANPTALIIKRFTRGWAGIHGRGSLEIGSHSKRIPHACTALSRHGEGSTKNSNVTTWLSHF